MAALPLSAAAVADDPAPLLFDSPFLSRLERLQLLARRPVAGGQPAARRSRQSGSSTEFADYRLYTPGDDLRRIDWNVYGRLDRLFLKLYEAEQDLPVHLLIDASASMRWRPEAGAGAARPAKLDLARRLAAAMAYIGLGHLDHVCLHFFGATLGPALDLGRGKGQFHRALGFLNRPPAAAGETDLRRSLQPFGQRARRRGLAIILSDFFDPGGGVEPALDRLLHHRFEVQLLQILDPAELEPALLGDLRLTEPELAGVLEVTADEALLRAYQQEMAAFLAGLRAFCARRQVPYFQASTAVGFDEVILRLLRAGQLAG